LADVEAMIVKVVAGAQEYYVGSRRVRYPSLKELQDLRESLLEEITMASAGGMMSIGVRVPPS
jgi:hypothetical protein